MTIFLNSQKYVRNKFNFKKMKSDDFLAQVTGTEAKAEQMIVDAETDKRTKLEEKSFTLNKEREAKYAEVRKNGEKRIADKNDSTKKEYESFVEKGKGEVKKLQADSKPKIESAVPNAQQFLLNELL